ncbi:hypothetical protein IAT38_006893 [Cryptococcus sp. DSM 104549]
MPSPALPGLFFCFAAMVLLLFVSVSPPVWDKVSFLKATAGSGQTVYGVFGSCVKGGSCTRRAVGYALNINGASDVNLDSPKVIHNLTYTLILHPIAGFLALLALVFGLLAVGCASRIATILMGFFSFWGFIVALVVFVIDMVLWNTTKNKLHDAGHAASLGNANWFTVGAVAALALASCTSICGACGRFATGRMAGEKY